MLRKSLSKSNIGQKSIKLRTIIKDRVNKQTVNQQLFKYNVSKFFNKSKNLQTVPNQDQDDKKSIKSTKSIRSNYQIKPSLNDTDNLKNFVRSMKKNKNKFIEINRNNCSLIQKKSKQNDQVRSISSTRSIKSNQSVRFKNKVLKKQLNMTDNQSVVSNRQFKYNSQFQNRSMSFNQKFIQDSLITKQTKLQQLKKIEQKMDNLINNKLKNLMLKAKYKYKHQSRNSFIGFGKPRPITFDPQNQKQDDIPTFLNKQIYQIVQSINNLKETQQKQNINYDNSYDQQIEQVNKKIQILQKTIASHFVQSEIIKKYYYAKKSQKNSDFSIKKESSLRQKLKQEILKPKSVVVYSQKNLTNKNMNVTRFQTTSGHFYTKPSRQSYNIDKHKQPSYSLNRQPLQRSTYQMDYLNYGPIQTIIYKPHNNIGQTIKINKTITNYQDQFKPRNIDVQQYNYKDFDCFKNKIKPNNISFSELYKNRDIIKKKYIKNNTNKFNQFKPLKEQKSQVNAQKQDKITSLQKKANKYYKNNVKFIGKSQMKSQYLWQNVQIKKCKQNNESQNQKLNKKVLLKSVIKNKNLLNLKAQYRAAFVR